MFRKWKTASGIIVCSRVELSLPDSFVERILLTDIELEKVGTGSGRGNVLRSELPNGDNYVLRPYRRGGMIQHVSKESFLSLPMGPLRPLIELEVLSILYDQEIPVPKPLFSLVQYGLLNLSYSCAIATGELLGARNFLDEHEHLDEESAERIAWRAGEFAGRALVAGVFHRDLHPGNVLYRSPEEVFLIDFDNSLRITQHNRSHFEDRLVSRWDRAVQKHRLKPELCSAFRAGMRSGVSESMKQDAIKGG